jgi:hypothetical protein
LLFISPAAARTHVARAETELNYLNPFDVFERFERMASPRQANILHFAMAMVTDCAVIPFDLHATVTDADNGTPCIAFLPSNVLSDF